MGTTEAPLFDDDNDHAWKFITTSPSAYEASQARSDASPPNLLPKKKQWELVASNFLTKKLPRQEQDWDRILHTQYDVNRILQLLVLPHLTPAEKAALSWQGLFDECATHFGLLSKDETYGSPIVLFRLAIIGLADVAIREGLPRDEAFHYLRECLRPHCRRGQQLGDESLRKLIKAVRQGVRFVELFTAVLGPRSNELPLYGMQSPWPRGSVAANREISGLVDDGLPSLYCRIRTIYVPIRIRRVSPEEAVTIRVFVGHKPGVSVIRGRL